MVHRGNATSNFAQLERHNDLFEKERQWSYTSTRAFFCIWKPAVHVLRTYQKGTTPFSHGTCMKAVVLVFAIWNLVYTCTADNVFERVWSLLSIRHVQELWMRCKLPLYKSIAIILLECGGKPTCFYLSHCILILLHWFFV